ncbi:cytoskeleton-associated protein 2-like [Pseudoliparis swirei]|uniref:cytoskeleton-associated protein 2-like n=1 Tax=Pseudoliparis swirei TaxID=2059687 RepID=UPI0024BEAA45|nr:cytoskeleton-associated protein 2-like [Pseudoliparis swirei]
MEEEEEEEAVPILSRKELRKLKFIEYLAGKGKLKPPNPKPYLRDNAPVKKHVTTSLQGKENTAPADRITRGGSNTLVAQPMKHAARKTFGDSNKVSVKASILIGRQNAVRPLAAGAPARPRPTHQTPALTGRSTAPSVRRNPTAAVQLKKRPDAGMPPSGRSHSSASCPAVTKPSGGFGAGSRPPTAVSVRMSLGPMVKTKTGLTPAVTKPRSVRSQHLKPTSATVAKTTQSSSLPPVSVSRKPGATQRKPLPATALNHRERPRAGMKVTHQSTSKPLVSRNPQPSSKIPSSSGPRATTAPFKPPGQPAGRFPKQRSKGAGQNKSQACKADPRAPSGRRAVRVPCSGTSHTAPRPGGAISRTGRPADAKTLKVPATEGKKVTAAQEERMRKLQAWREAKGISYKRPPMPATPQVRRAVAAVQPFWGAMSEEDDAQSLISAVDRSLADCIKLLGEGCPPGPVREVLSRLPPVSQKFSKYWICRARLLELEGHLDVLPMFQEAVRVVLEPVDELRAVVFEILKKRDDLRASADKEEEQEQSPTCERTPGSVDNLMATPKPVRGLICGEQGDSSVVKYKITATPGGAARQQAEPARLNGQEVRFFTPVRRSVRIERSSLRYPASLQDHDLCVSSYGDLIHKEEEEGGGEREGGASSLVYVYRQNDALEDKVFVRLVYADAN